MFAALCLVGALVIGAAIYWAKTRDLDALPEQPFSAIASSVPDVGAAPSVGAPTRIYFRYTALGPHFGRLATVEYGRRAEVTFIDALSCEAVHASAERGVCLAADRGVVTTYTAKLFDARTYEVLESFDLPGIPSRTRVSADGKLAATTVFVTGHGYDSVDFSTQTLLIDVGRQEVIGDLEKFSVTERGAPIGNADFNFWGVTFLADNNTFYATLSTSGRHVLVRGNIAARTAEVVHENVECPSLSPDGTRVAYKKRFSRDGRITWQLHVLDLATFQETSLSEERSVDDQLEWLDESHVLYSVRGSDPSSAATTDVWMARADGTGTPEVFLRTAYSPAVVR